MIIGILSTNVFYRMTKQINPVSKPFQCCSVAGRTVEEVVGVYELENPHEIYLALSRCLQSGKACPLLSSLSASMEV